jgi:hypothetical protein
VEKAMMLVKAKNTQLKYIHLAILIILKKYWTVPVHAEYTYAHGSSAPAKVLQLRVGFSICGAAIPRSDALSWILKERCHRQSLHPVRH